MSFIKCKMCGSTDMLKQGDYWVCQSCGIKQTEEKYMDRVLIDHSNDVENLIIRANQFLGKGDSTKALEYFNKALDIDPYNETALNAVKALETDDFSEDDETETVVYISKRAVSAQDGIRNFFNALLKKEVVPDVFSNIKIVSVTEKYYLAAMPQANYTVSYQATACHNRSVPRTVYEEKTFYVNGLRRTRRVPKTEYFKEFDHSEDVSGEFEHSSSETYLFSENLLDVLIKNKCTELRDNLCKNLSQNFDVSTLIPLSDVVDSSETAVDQIESRCLESREKAAVEKFIKNLKENAADVAAFYCPGDYVTNMSVELADFALNWISFYIPIQTIEYEYKGERFTALQTLCAGETVLVMTYPHKEKLQDESLNNRTQTDAEKSGEDNEPEVDSGFSDISKLALILLVIGAFPYFLLADFYGMFALSVFAVIGIVVAHFKKIQRQRRELKSYDEIKSAAKQQKEKFENNCENNIYLSWKKLTELYDKSLDYTTALEQLKNAYDWTYNAYSSKTLVEIPQRNDLSVTAAAVSGIRPRVVVSTGSRLYHYNGVVAVLNREETILKGLELTSVRVNSPGNITFRENPFVPSAADKELSFADDEISVFRVEYTNDGFEVHKTSRKLAEFGSAEDIEGYISGVVEEYEVKAKAKEEAQKINFAEIFAGWKRKAAQRKGDVQAQPQDKPSKKDGNKSIEASDAELKKAPSKFDEIAAKIAKVVGIGLLVIVGLFIVLMLLV